MLKPIFFNRAPIAIKLHASAIAGLSCLFKAASPWKKYLELINVLFVYPPRNNLPTSGFFNKSSPFPAIAVCPETKT